MRVLQNWFPLALTLATSARVVSSLRLASEIQMPLPEHRDAGCPEDGNFEFTLDRLSWAAFSGTDAASLDAPYMGADVRWVLRHVAFSNTSMEASHVVAEHGVDRHSDVAGLLEGRLSGWWDATVRSGMSRRSTTRRSGGVEQMLPPACPDDVPANDTYWAQSDPYVVGNLTYNECRFSSGCTKRYTNRQRFDSIRAAVHVATKFLEGQGMEALLYGGTAIGAFRCGDVLPWDVDADVLVRQDKVVKLLELFSERGDSEGKGFQGKGRELDLKSFGFDGFSLLEKVPGCMPFAVVDQATGFFADIFPMRERADSIISPWYSAKTRCNSSELFPPCFSDRCNSYVPDHVLPARNCSLGADKGFKCASKADDWLAASYGPEVLSQPNRPTRGAA